MRAERILLEGPAPTAVLKLLERSPRDGYELIRELHLACPEALSQGDASLLALLYYLERHQFIAGEWQMLAGTRRKIYSLTEHGRQRLATEARHWQALTPLLGQNVTTTGDVAEGSSHA
jgi:DNA-binding PadR family transcriptional regulator